MLLFKGGVLIYAEHCIYVYMRNICLLLRRTRPKTVSANTLICIKSKEFENRYHMVNVGSWSFAGQYISTC